MQCVQNTATYHLSVCNTNLPPQPTAIHPFAYILLHAMASYYCWLHCLAESVSLAEIFCFILWPPTTANFTVWLTQSLFHWWKSFVCTPYSFCFGLQYLLIFGNQCCWAAELLFYWARFVLLAGIHPLWSMLWSPTTTAGFTVWLSLFYWWKSFVSLGQICFAGGNPSILVYAMVPYYYCWFYYFIGHISLPETCLLYLLQATAGFTIRLKLFSKQPHLDTLTCVHCYRK